MTVTFTHLGHTYTGTLEPVFGGACPTYHLMIDNYYRGKLWYSEQGWQWDSLLFPGIMEEVVAAVEKSPD